MHEPQGANGSLGILAALVALLLMSSLISCGEKLPQELGVYAYTDQGLIEISKNGSGESRKYFEIESEIGRIDSISAFLVNIPDAIIAESNIYWINTGHNPQRVYYKDIVSIEKSIKQLKNGIYKFELESHDFDKPGYIALRLSMPLGVPDRLYVLGIGEEKIAVNPSPVYVDLSQLPPPNIQKTVNKPEIEKERFDTVSRIEYSGDSISDSNGSGSPKIVMGRKTPAKDDNVGFEQDSLVKPTTDPNEYYPGPDEFVAYDKKPILLQASEPEYPMLAKKAGIEGTVWIKALVDKRGEVLNAIVIKESGHNAGFEQAAIKAAFNSKYKPAMQNNQPVALWVEYKVDFTL